MTKIRVDLDRLQSMLKHRKLTESVSESSEMEPYVGATSIQGQRKDYNANSNMGDNPMLRKDDEAEESLAEGEGDNLEMMNKMHDLLKQVGITDQAILAQRVSLKPSGAVKLARILTGQSMSEQDAVAFVNNAIFELGQHLIDQREQPPTSLADQVAEDEGDNLESADGDEGDGITDDDDQLDEFYMPSDYERFSYTTDSLGNVSVQDADTGKSVYLTGSDAVELLGELEMYGGSAEKEQDVLSKYEHVMEAQLEGFAGDLAQEFHKVKPNPVQTTESLETLADMAPELLEKLIEIESWLEQGDVDESFILPIKILVARGKAALK